MWWEKRKKWGLEFKYLSFATPLCSFLSLTLVSSLILFESQFPYNDYLIKQTNKKDNECEGAREFYDNIYKVVQYFHLNQFGTIICRTFQV